MSVLIAVFTSVVLAAPFSTASAAAVDDSAGLAVEITVAYSGGAEAVIVRPHSPFEELPPTALSDLGEGEWGGIVVFPTAENWSVAFEAFPSDGASVISDTTDLLAMGVDPVVIQSEVDTPLPSDPLVPEGSWWLVIGIVLALAALVVLAVWTFGGGGGGEPETDDGSEVTDSPPSTTA